MIDYNALEFAICKAEREARKYEDIEDGGSCNFDTPIIKLDHAERKKLAEFDWDVIPVSGRYYKGWYFVFIHLSGQAARRTKMAEVAAASLQADGYNASVYYQLD